MNLRREATQTIWKTVVFAGAMLGSAACHKSKPPVAPDMMTKPAQTDADDPDGKKKQPDPDDPCAAADPCGGDDEWTDPCGDRARGTSDEGNEGRGFILS